MTKELETGGPMFPNDSGDDRDNNGMTTRTYAAIHLRVPMSEHDWLNKMIRESQRQELAKAAMQGILADQSFPEEFDIAGAAFEVTDAMLAEQEKENG